VWNVDVGTRQDGCMEASWDDRVAAFWVNADDTDAAATPYDRLTNRSHIVTVLSTWS
jgi:hypothetical protein